MKENHEEGSARRENKKPSNICMCMYICINIYI